jgi:uncharacterized membrane-anchored protein YhcB (DUF1043 family)
MTEAWVQIITLIGSNIALILIMFGSTIAIWLHTDKKIDAIQKEMKDFHGTLERQDAEFKSHMKYANHGTKEGK